MLKEVKFRKSFLNYQALKGTEAASRLGAANRPASRELNRSKKTVGGRGFNISVKEEFTLSFGEIGEGGKVDLKTQAQTGKVIMNG